VAKILSVAARRIRNCKERLGSCAQSTATMETFYAHGVNNKRAINTFEFQ
jgi:hypothetical protein